MKFTKPQLKRFAQIENSLDELLDVLLNAKIDPEGKIMFRGSDLVKIANKELCTERRFRVRRASKLTPSLK